MDSFHEDEINFGHEEAVRMHANAPSPWDEAEKWLQTTTGQEFCDELVRGTVGRETTYSLLRSFNINCNQTNHNKFILLADRLITTGEA